MGATRQCVVMFSGSSVAINSADDKGENIEEHIDKVLTAAYEKGGGIVSFSQFRIRMDTVVCWYFHDAIKDETAIRHAEALERLAAVAEREYEGDECKDSL
jgi:hypothetical protein